MLPLTLSSLPYFIVFPDFINSFSSSSDFHKDLEGEQQQQPQKKKGAKFKPIKVLKRLSHKGEPSKSHSPRKEKTP